MMKRVEYPKLQQLLIAYSHLHRILLQASLLIPLANKWNIKCSSHASMLEIEWSRGPQESKILIGLRFVEGLILKDGFKTIREGEIIKIRLIKKINLTLT
jgi:hypothetical protein